MTDADEAKRCGCPKEYHDVICPLGLRGSRALESRTNDAEAIRRATLVAHNPEAALAEYRADKAFSWIKVRRYVDDPTRSWEERYRALEKHHELETKFLIAEVEKHRSADPQRMELRRLAILGARQEVGGDGPAFDAESCAEAMVDTLLRSETAEVDAAEQGQAASSVSASENQRTNEARPSKIGVPERFEAQLQVAEIIAQRDAQRPDNPALRRPDLLEEAIDALHRGHYRIDRGDDPRSVARELESERMRIAEARPAKAAHERGCLCERCMARADVIVAAARILNEVDKLAGVMRVPGRGEQPFVTVSWDAINALADALPDRRFRPAKPAHPSPYTRELQAILENAVDATPGLAQAIDALRAEERMRWSETAMHASAPAGMRCADCAIDGSPCAACLRAGGRT